MKDLQLKRLVVSTMGFEGQGNLSELNLVGMRCLFITSPDRFVGSGSRVLTLDMNLPKG